MSEQLFDPPVQQWTMLDPKYLSLLRISVLTTWPFVALPLVIAGFVFNWILGVVVLAAAIAFIIFRLWRQRRIYQMWGYARSERDLYIRSGVFFRRMTVIPYGRMQAVTVSSGPIARRLGLARVQLVSAAIISPDSIPGLNADVADKLRHELVELGESQAAGL